jgi:hypothetical protein
MSCFTQTGGPSFSSNGRQRLQARYPAPIASFTDGKYSMFLASARRELHDGRQKIPVVRTPQ